MTIKGIRTQQINLDPDSFGAWFDHRSDDEPYLGTLTDRYPSVGDQIDLCWDMLRIRDFDLDDPVGSLRRAIWEDEMDRYYRSDDENWAWNEHDFPEGWTPSSFAREEAEWESEDFLAESERVAAPTLWERIEEALPESTWPPAPSKKRRIDDRRPRYERRDGSTRSHYYRYGVMKHDVQIRIRRERARIKAELRAVKWGVGDPDDLTLNRQSTAWNEELMAA